MPAETDLHNALYQNCTFLFHHYATKKAQGKKYTFGIGSLEGKALGLRY